MLAQAVCSSAQPVIVNDGRYLWNRAVAPFAPCKLIDRARQIEWREVGPHASGENQLGVSTLPKQKIAEPLFAAGSNQDIDGPGLTEQRLEIFA